MSVSVKSFEETPSFHSSTQEVDSVQQVFPIPLLEPLVFLAHYALDQAIL